MGKIIALIMLITTISVMGCDYMFGMDHTRLQNQTINSVGNETK